MSAPEARWTSSPLLWPLPPHAVLVPAGLILVLTLASTWGQLSWRALDWVYLSGQVGAQARLPVAVAAGAAALVAVRFARSSLVFAQSWQPRVERDVPVRQAALVTGWCLGAYLLGLLPLTAAVASAGAGLPQPVPVLGALTGFAALTLFGYLCGVALRGLVAVPVAVGAVFVFTSLPLVTDAWTALALQLPFDTFLGVRENSALGLYRLGFFLLLAAASAWTASSLLRAPRRPSAPHAAAVTAVAAAVVLPHLYAFPLVVHATGGTEVCEARDGVRYCVHEGHADELAPIVDLAAPVVAAYGSADATPAQVRDQSLATGDREVLDGVDRGVLWLRVHPGWEPRREVPWAVAEWLAPDVFVCDSKGVASTDEGATPEERRAAVVAGLQAWLASESLPGGPRDGGPFAGADPDQVRAWISANEDALASCSVEPEDLPWWP
ncbi:ABC transporter permease [Nocardiopsis sp. NPDC006938]|uniref:ABC transporter permease n=1 Tax=Nocardiopsis sp. NPDC006938 TaxID=3364337 RepID=UPI003683D5A5